jgi:hypothetical protein
VALRRRALAIVWSVDESGPFQPPLAKAIAFGQTNAVTLRAMTRACCVRASSGRCALLTPFIQSAPAFSSYRAHTGGGADAW